MHLWVYNVFMIKKLITIIFCCVFAAGLFAEKPISEEDVRNQAYSKIKDASADLESMMTAFVNGFSKAVAPNAVQHNVWADAYIGKVFPSFPPHLGAGVSFMTSTMKIDGMNEIIDDAEMGAMGEFFKKMGFPLPSATGNLRVGGVFLPFDLGVSFMKYKNDDLFSTGMAFDYMTVGVDIRYAIMEQTLTRPDISVGFGWTKVAGNLSKGFSITDSSGVKIDGLVATGFDTNVYCFSGQISKSLLGNVLTPYAGTRLAFQQGTYGWNTDLEGKYTVENVSAQIDYNNEYDNNINFGQKPVFQLYGGIGFRGLIFDTNLGVCFDFVSKSFGSNFSFRLVL